MIPNFAEFVNEENVKKVEKISEELNEAGKPEFKDVTKEELQNVYKETDLETKKEKAKVLINQLAAKKKVPALLAPIDKATTPLSVDQIITNVALVPFKVI